MFFHVLEFSFDTCTRSLTPVPPDLTSPPPTCTWRDSRRVWPGNRQNRPSKHYSPHSEKSSTRASSSTRAQVKRWKSLFKQIRKRKFYASQYRFKGRSSPSSAVLLTWVYLERCFLTNGFCFRPVQGHRFRALRSAERGSRRDRRTQRVNASRIHRNTQHQVFVTYSPKDDTVLFSSSDLLTNK